MSLTLDRQTAHEVWQIVEELFAHKSKNRELHLREELQLLKREALSVSEHVRKFRAICDQLSAIGNPVLPKVVPAFLRMNYCSKVSHLHRIITMWLSRLEGEEEIFDMEIEDEATDLNIGIKILLKEGGNITTITEEQPTTVVATTLHGFLKIMGTTVVVMMFHDYLMIMGIDLNNMSKEILNLQPLHPCVRSVIVGVILLLNVATSSIKLINPLQSQKLLLLSLFRILQMQSGTLTVEPPPTSPTMKVTSPICSLIRAQIKFVLDNDCLFIFSPTGFIIQEQGTKKVLETGSRRVGYILAQHTSSQSLHHDAPSAVLLDQRLPQIQISLVALPEALPSPMTHDQGIDSSCASETTSPQISPIAIPAALSSLMTIDQCITSSCASEPPSPPIHDFGNLSSNILGGHIVIDLPIDPNITIASFTDNTHPMITRSKSTKHPIPPHTSTSHHGEDKSDTPRFGSDYSKSNQVTLEVDLKKMDDNGTISGENEKGDSVYIQILANSIRKNLMIVPPLSSETCIYRVPDDLRRISESAYTPQLVSIGPFHRDNGSLRKMDLHKRSYLQTYLDLYPEIQLESCLEDLWGLEERARQCYAERINLNKFQFVEMMLLDSFFIIMFLIKSYSPERWDNDPILGNMWMPLIIQNDMILLENQLPFFVLEQLFNLVSISNQQYTYPNLFDLTIHVLCGFVNMTNPSTIDRSEVKHILDLLRRCCIPFPLSPTEAPQDVSTSKVRYSVTELHDASVKFKAGVSESSCLLDLKFTDGVLEIQPLFIEGRTNSFFRNLIALEQCHYPNFAYVTCFAIFMDYLINTPNDAGLLIRYEIIENYLGDREEVSRFINNLSKDVTSDDETSYFSGDYMRLDAYCKNHRHKWMASLRRDYFYSPWAIISFIAAVLLIILTLIQTVCSLISL
ncbi:hypothetical protein HHK36_032559 [Tetracentron sinense]|uniref:Uncharacterized protein n=1 Tax=Tetracentron sinense TaxID=13715 RepID=A0A834Y5B3_TETSI|nr:hypothetical protein HHK36_032559 [Tetracentron sinense]